MHVESVLIQEEGGTCQVKLTAARTKYLNSTGTPRRQPFLLNTETKYKNNLWNGPHNNALISLEKTDAQNEDNKPRHAIRTKDDPTPSGR